VVGAILLERFCAHHRIGHGSIDELVEHLWTLATAEDVPEWERHGAALALTGRGDVPPAGLREACPDVEWSVFVRLVENVVEIGIVDLYGQNTKRPRAHAKDVWQTATAYGIESADLRRIQEEAWGARGYGDPLPRDLVASWQSLRPVSPLRERSTTRPARTPPWL
jgi:hypothetical protein